MPSFVWNYYTKTNSNKAKCNQVCCNKELSFAKGTSSLIHHLKANHNIVDVTTSTTSTKRPAPDETDQTRKRQKQMNDFFIKPTIEEEVARMVAESNLTFNQIATTKFIRYSLANKFPGKIIPLRNEGISDLMMKFFDFAETETKCRIREMKDNGKKFSATLDEWTSTSNSRYLNINLHYSVSSDGSTCFFNLGLIKIKGSCPADAMVKLFSDRIKYFGLNVLTDLVAVTGDGAPIMVKFGRLLGVPYLLCLNHTIHLAVSDKLFTKKVHNEGESSEDEDTDEETDADRCNEIFQIHPNYNATVKKMHGIIKIFRYSPLKSGILEDIQKKDGMKLLKFVVAVSTRWNSLVMSGKRFLDILPSTLKALEHRDIRSNLVWTENDTNVLREIVDVLEPARVATENLSNSSINLLVGEGILKFLFNEITDIKMRYRSDLICNFKDAMESRLKQRRDIALHSLVLYLSNSDSLTSDHPLELANKAVVVKTGLEMMKRLFGNDGSVDITQEFPVEVPKTSLQERLKLSVGSVQKKSPQSQQVSDPFEKEFDYYDRHGVRGPFLNKFYDALCSAQPTSTQSERNFSLAAGIATKKRAKMSSEKLNACCFLKSYFANKK